MNFMPLYLSQAPRLFGFPLPVSAVGRALMGDQHYHGFHNNQIEYCLRLRSEDEVAIDFVDGREYRNTFPHLFIKRNDELHDYEYKHEREAFFMIYSSSLRPVLDALHIPPDPICWPIRLTPKLTGMMHEIMTLFPESQFPGTADRIDLLCFQILQEVYLMRRESTSAGDYNENKIRRIASYLHLNFNGEIRWDRLFRENGLSRRSFFRYWNKYYTVSPGRYIGELKMKEAVRMLERRDLSISEIAAALNFQDCAYFIRAFRRRYRMTPLQFRKQRSSRPPDSLSDPLSNA